MRLDFDDVVKQYWVSLYKKALARCYGNHTFAEEAMQETLTSAWKHQEQFTGGNVKAWLTRILCNKISDSFRPNRKGSFAHVSLDIGAGTMNDDQENSLAGASESFESLTVMDPLPEFERVDVVGIVAKVIEALPNEYKDVCKLRLLKGLQQKEVAKELNLPVGTIMSRMFRIKPLLQERVSALLATA